MLDPAIEGLIVDIDGTLLVHDMGLDPGRVLVVGDDVSSDGRGGASAGCRTALVRTGRFQGSPAELAGFRPDLVLDSVAALEP